MEHKQIKKNSFEPFLPVHWTLLLADGLVYTQFQASSSSIVVSWLLL